MTHPDNHLPAILWLLGGVVAATAMDAAVKWLIEDYSVFQIIAVRGWFVAVIFIAWRWRDGGHLRDFLTARWRLSLLRMVSGVIALTFFFTALKTMPLADTTAVFFAAPFLVTALSALIFKDRVGWRRWTAIAIGFVGVVIAMQPGPETFQAAAVLPLIAAVGYAMSMILGRRLATTEPVYRLAFYHNAGLTILGTAALPFGWAPVSAADMMIMLLVGVLSLGAVYALTKAYVMAPAGIVAPFEYVALPFAVMFGFVLFGDVPITPVFIGIGVIIFAGLFLINRKNKLIKSKN